jgi:4-amino-4-deoxychorismate lyase
MRFEVVNHLEQRSPIDYLNNRGLMFGDGFFTTGRIVGGELEYQQQHYERLIESAERLKFKRFDVNLVNQKLSKLIGHVANASIRISVYRMQMKRGYGIADDAQIGCLINLNPSVPIPIEPCHLRSAQTALSVNSSLAGIKHLNRLDSVLAASEINSPNQERLMWNQDHVVCGSRTNLFIKVGKRWITPALELCGINGLTRARVLAEMSQRQIACDIAPIDRDCLASANAAFVTNSLIGVWPVASINKSEVELERSQFIQQIMARSV